MKKIIGWLRRPYPIMESFQEKCTLALILGIVVSIVLFLFQPFGIRNIESIKLLSIGGFGIITTVVSLALCILVALLPQFGYREQSWNVGRQIGLMIAILFFISYGNWWLNNSISSVTKVQCYSIGQFFSITTLVGIVPMVVSIFYSEKVIRQRNCVTAQDLSRDIQREPSYYSPVPVLPHQFLYAKTEGNYIQLFKVNGQSEILRITMKELEMIYSEEPMIVRCHRSFMVNRLSLVTVKGNAAGLVIQLKSGDEIPVSRSYVPVFKKSISVGQK